MPEDMVELDGPFVRRGTKDVFVDEGVIGEARVASEEEVTLTRWKDL